MAKHSQGATQTNEQTNRAWGWNTSFTGRPCAYAPGRTGMSAAPRKTTAASRLWLVAVAYSPFRRMSGTCH